MEEDQRQPPIKKWRARRIVPVVLVIVLIVVAVVITVGVKGGFAPGPTTTPTPTPTASFAPSACEIARDSIQAALDDYYAEYGEWPTANGQPGDIEWTELVPDFMEAVPANDSKCDWQVNSDPEGKVCVPKRC